MEHSELFFQILLVTAAAFVGGFVAHALRLPTIIGFLAAGVAIGPNTPGPVGNVEDVQALAELGAIFLMFGLGIQVSFRDLLAYRRIALVGGGLQVGLTFLVAFAVAPLIGLGWQEGIILGFLVSISSTAVAIKVLESRQEMNSLHARSVIALAIFQDLAVVPMIIAIPALGGDGIGPFDLLAAVAKAVFLIAVTYLMASRVVPGVWRQVALRRSRELTILVSLSFAIGFAAGSALLGLSVAFGAFLAGLAVSESEYGHESLIEILPLRDVFATVFFVAIGMLIVPDAVIEQAATVLLIIVLAVIGKGLITSAIMRALNWPPRAALLTGLAMAQMGEFSFVLARAAIGEDLISDDLASAFLFAAGVTIILCPLGLRAGDAISGMGARLPFIRSLFVERGQALNLPAESELRRHVVICGFGGTAAAIIRTLRGRNLPFVIVDNNPYLVDDARLANLPFVYGDATRSEILELAGVRQARLLAVTIPGARDAEAVIRQGLTMNPGLDVITRGSGREIHALLRRAGSSEVVDSDFESSLEFVRHVLHRYGVDGREIATLQARLRAEQYRTGS